MSKEKEKAPKVDSTLLEKSAKAQKKLELYFKENKLDPTKDWSKSKKHGKAIQALLAVINTTRDKIKDAAPVEKHHKKSEDNQPKVKKESKPQKYDYPLVDGKEMTSGEKKKYRVKMRAGDAKPEKSEKATDKKAKTETSQTGAKANTKVKVEVKSEKKTAKAPAVAEAKKTVKKSGKKKNKSRKED